MANGSVEIAGEHRRGGGAADQHPAGRRQRLQPGGRVDDVAHRRVVRAGERADQHLAGVDADAHLDRRAGGGAALGDVPGKAVLHPQRRPDRPFGIVLVGDGRAEQRHDAVTEQLVDASAEVVDVGDQPFEARFDEQLDVLRVEVLGQRGVPHEVGEHDRDDAALLGRDARTSGGRAARGAEAGPRRHRLGARGAGGRRHDRNATAAGPAPSSRLTSIHPSSDDRPRPRG